MQRDLRNTARIQHVVQTEIRTKTVGGVARDRRQFVRGRLLVSALLLLYHSQGRTVVVEERGTQMYFVCVFATDVLFFFFWEIKII